MATAEERNAIRLFGDYMRVTGTPSLKDEAGKDPHLAGKKLGVINGSSWVSLWSTWFGKKMLPGVRIINAGNEAVQLNFMKAHSEGKISPPRENIELFCRYAKDLHDLFSVDAVMISCSTMNRAYASVLKYMKPFNVPVIQIDQAMMEEAVNSEGKILVVATHGPTVKSTQELLAETGARIGKQVVYTGTTVEKAFDLLGKGEIERHNMVIAEAIRKVMGKQEIEIVVLAQLSMSVFTFSFPDPVKEFGVKVLNSGETGFRRAGEVLASLKL